MMCKTQHRSSRAWNPTDLVLQLEHSEATPPALSLEARAGAEQNPQPLLPTSFSACCAARRAARPPFCAPCCSPPAAAEKARGCHGRNAARAAAARPTLAGSAAAAAAARVPCCCSGAATSTGIATKAGAVSWAPQEQGAAGQRASVDWQRRRRQRRRRHETGCGPPHRRALLPLRWSPGA